MYLPRRPFNVSMKRAEAPSAASRRLGMVAYLLGIIGLFVAAALLWVVDHIRFEEPPSLVRIPGLQEEVAVITDASGTYHLHGTSWEDLLRAQGWIHARERLWQMELGRLAGEGRLAELFGPLALPADRVMRTLGLHRVARTRVERLPVKSRRLLEAYVDGINTYLESDSYRPPPELFMLGWTPEPWTPDCSALVTGLMSLSLSSNWAQEAVCASLETGFPVDAVALLLPDSDEGPFITGNGTNPYPDTPSTTPSPAAPAVLLVDIVDHLHWSELARGTHLFRRALGIQAGGMGSNAWAVSGRRTRTGKPLLANDPHLMVQIPSLWISMGLHLGDRHLAGVSIPGLPLIIIGRTASFAWAFANTMADNQDLYIERPVEGEPDKYWFRGQTRPFTTRAETLYVRGGEPQVLEVRSTHHGPIINGVVVDMLHAEEAVSDIEGHAAVEAEAAEHRGVTQWVESAPPIALRWTMLEAGEELHSVIQLLDVTGWEDLREMFRSYGSPGQSVVFADTTGFVGYQFTGIVPVRRGWDGSRPVPGWTGDYEWDGYIPYEELPRLENPPGGIVVAANNPPLTPGSEPFLGRWWIPPTRARRIEARLVEVGLHTLDTFEDIQRDVLSVGAGEIIGDLMRLPRSGPYGERAMSILGGWDGGLTPTGPGALYEAFIAGFFPNLLEDELGVDGLRDYLALLEFFDGRYPVIRRMLQLPDAPWWDDVRTAGVEEREAVLERLWRRAWNEVTERFGPEPERWRWSRMHTLVLRHPLGRFWPLSGLFNRGPVEMVGDNDTICNSHYLLTDPYATRVASSWRHLVDLSSPVRAREILPTGNSGHFLSPGYDDHLEDWLAGRTRPAATTWSQAVSAAVRRIRLVP